IHGNGEIAVLQQMAGEEVTALQPQLRPIIEWTARQLNAEQEQLLRQWPRTTVLEIHPLGRILFCHATPRDVNEIFTQRTSEERLQTMFAGIDAQVVVCGHTHMQFDRTIGRLRIVNAGSVGMPFGEAGADWLLLGPDIQLRHTSYDLQRAAERIRKTKYPQAQEFAARHVLQPPT